MIPSSKVRSVTAAGATHTPIPITKITDGSDFEQQALTFYLEVEGDPLLPL